MILIGAMATVFQAPAFGAVSTAVPSNCAGWPPPSTYTPAITRVAVLPPSRYRLSVSAVPVVVE
ncbi:MAG: hypothetical protein B7Y51_08730 [Burkholderiales bacterium 28-67-8]|nr:MAG: hypothetical protein B7Y51_08730 [Burkholderiales bacterium 28-67-8]